MALVRQTPSRVFRTLHCALDGLLLQFHTISKCSSTVSCMAFGIIGKVYLWDFRVTIWNTCHCSARREVALCPRMDVLSGELALLCD